MSRLSYDLSSASALVVGDAMLDRYWFGSVDRISPEAPVPIVAVNREEYRLGGAANVALNAATLGGRSALLSVVGDDEPADRINVMLENAGIEALLKRVPSLQTTVKLRVSGRAQQLIRIDFEDRPDHEVLAAMTDLFTAHAMHFGSIIFSDYGKGGLAHIATMLETARGLGKPVLIDPKGSDYRCYRGATVITPNRAELAQVVGRWNNESDLEARAQSLRETLKLDALLVTRSEEGMSLFDANGHLRVPTKAREVYDVTGAGDTVIATLGILLAAGAALRDAVPIANEAASIVVGKFGTAHITAEELFR